MRTTLSFLISLALLLGSLCAEYGLATPPALAQSANVCGNTLVKPPTITSTPPLLPTFTNNNGPIDCYMWQTFISLTWPAQQGVQPDPNAHYGQEGMTVWESFLPYDLVFLPGGEKPQPWPKAMLSSGAIPSDNIRRLKSKNMIFRKDISPQPTKLAAIILSRIGLARLANMFYSPSPQDALLRETQQTDRNVLYDQNKKPVYYEMLLNKSAYDYILSNNLYEAGAQYTFAKDKGIALPAGSVEIKAAWKILQNSEAQSGLFHTAKAFIDAQSIPVTVGLVGMHIFVRPSDDSFKQGFWATFAHIDNSPYKVAQPGKTYSFYNPACNPEDCPVNNPKTNPSQVMQVFPVDSYAQLVNKYTQKLIETSNPNNPWKNYQLLNVQWPQSSSNDIGQPAKITPLSSGSPNTSTLMNPVMETFQQQSKYSCLYCHVNAKVARPSGVSNPKDYASSLSFLFGHAQSNSDISLSKNKTTPSE
jgi:hypothetical protein